MFSKDLGRRGHNQNNFYKVRYVSIVCRLCTLPVRIFGTVKAESLEIFLGCFIPAEAKSVHQAGKQNIIVSSK